MIMISYKVLRCPKNDDELIRTYADHLGPVLAPLVQRATEYSGVAHELHVPMFMAAWENGGIRVFMAYDDGRPVGVLIGYVFVPLWHEETTMTIEKWYAETPEIAQGLFEYVQGLQDAIGVKQMFAVDHPGAKLPELTNVNDKDSFSMVCIGG